MINVKNLKIEFFTVEKLSFIFFIFYFLFSIFFVKGFVNPVNLVNILVQCSYLIILACGMTFVFMNGGIDFSLTATVGLGSVIGARIMTIPGPPVLLTFLGLLVMVAIGVGIGALNGLTITRFKMPSFIATMATQLIFAGLALWYTESATIGGLPDAFLFIGQGKIIGVPMPIIITVIVVLFASYILHRSVFGKYIYAVGTNHRTSRISGIPVNKTIFTLFVFSGVLASISGIIMTSRSGAGMPAIGKNMLMDIVGAVVIGGTAVTGGRGNMLGTVVGAILIVVLNNSLNLLNVEWYIITALKGTMIIIVALLGIMLNARNK